MPKTTQKTGGDDQEAGKGLVMEISAADKIMKWKQVGQAACTFSSLTLTPFRATCDGCKSSEVYNQSRSPGKVRIPSKGSVGLWKAEQ